MRAWFVELPKLFIRKTQGKCGSATQVMKDVLSRSVRGASRRNGGEYRDDPEIGDGKQGLSIAEVVIQDPGLNGRVKENWRIRWKRALTVPAFRSPLTKILSPVVTRAQWEAVIRSGALAFVISVIVVAVLVAVPVP